MVKYLKKIGCLLFVMVLAGSAIASDYHFVVATDGTGDFRTVQDAINAVPDFRKNETLIFIKNGIYKEKLVLAGSKTNVVFIGEDRDKTILTYDDFAQKKNRFGEEVGTTGSTSFFVITAPSTNEGTAHGFVFLDCKITGTAPEGSFYLGRPWRPFGRSAFLRCELGGMIKPEGWHNWGKADNEKTCFFAEYKNSGSGASIEKRVSWSHQLSDAEATGYTPEKILGEWVVRFK
jgi:pectinesterase